MSNSYVESVGSRLERLVQAFQNMAPTSRLKLLSSYASKLPPLPERYQGHGFFQDEDCKTPFYIALEQHQNIHLFFDAPKDALLIWAFGGMLYELIEDASREEVLALSPDFYKALGLEALLSEMRLRTLGVMLMKVKVELKKLPAPTLEVNT
ncbi:MAG: SufE family protein [Deinococcales bacterium]